MRGRDDLGDAHKGRLHPDRVARRDARDDGAEAELVGATHADIATGPLGLDSLVVELGVGLDDLRLGDSKHATAGLVRDDPGDRRVHDAHLLDGQVP